MKGMQRLWHLTGVNRWTRDTTHFSRETNIGGDHVKKKKQFEVPTREVRLPTLSEYDTSKPQLKCPSESIHPRNDDCFYIYSATGRAEEETFHFKTLCELEYFRIST